ncbi:MAG: hypothetical protein EP329_27440 [Deltaproteobacteria bacterium]|nr:MAG: hypothetical protein EP329_27440 [Deltaproteobacteria bacterium]
MSEPQEDFERYDVLIVSQSRDFNLVEQGVKSLINYLATSNFMRPAEEAIAKEWVEIYGPPGPTAHEAFTRGAYSGDYAVFKEATVRGGTKYIQMPFGGAKNEGVRFYIAFYGVLWKELSPSFKNRLTRLLVTRIDVFTRVHEAVPPHAEVGKDELPDEQKFAKKDRTSPRVGTAVEEF